MRMPLLAVDSVGHGRGLKRRLRGGRMNDRMRHTPQCSELWRRLQFHFNIYARRQVQLHQGINRFR